MTFGFVKPLNSIIVDDNSGGRKPLIQGLKVESATTMYPGRLVIAGTHDDDVTVCGAGGIAIGWLGYEQADPEKPNDVDTLYAVDDMVPVIYGGGFVLVATLAASQTIVKGDRLVAGASGMVTKALAASVTTGSATASAVSGTDPTITGSIGIGGIVVGIAMETITTTGSTADIIVLSLI